MCVNSRTAYPPRRPPTRHRHRHGAANPPPPPPPRPRPAPPGSSMLVPRIASGVCTECSRVTAADEEKNVWAGGVLYSTVYVGWGWMHRVGHPGGGRVREGKRTRQRRKSKGTHHTDGTGSVAMQPRPGCVPGRHGNRRPAVYAGAWVRGDTARHSTAIRPLAGCSSPIDLLHAHTILCWCYTLGSE